MTIRVSSLVTAHEISNNVMYREGAEGKDEAYLKLYDGHDWKWFCVRLAHTDMEYLRKYWSGKKASAPTL